MMRDHSHEHAGNSLVSCVCRICGKRFYRNGDEVSASLSFSSPGCSDREDPSKSRTWREWVISKTNHCDEHLPRVPRAVLNDVAREGRRRTEENVHLMVSKREDESRAEGDGLRTIDEWKEMARWRGMM